MSTRAPIDLELGLSSIAGKAKLIERLTYEAGDSNLEDPELFEAIRCIAIVMQQESRQARARVTRDARRRGLLRAVSEGSAS